MVCNAGGGGLESLMPIRETPVEMFNFNFDLNVKCCFIMTKHALPHLEKTKGSIVFISSLTGNKMKNTYTKENIRSCFSFPLVLKLA
jgi:NAD(P)-dependent dehydrogenase (short-subunit alcohol dehydrogenase family)